ncbi:short-chain dehydrogenase/reductase [Westerdykella ornata]|uniref:Short-chain dehydrogenase/reductase n=1 Tax=Westerdykella ornata TaxID=318751 RepID=A0A6A6JF64_WESOR|nr:short-chain dehydrogenase/reductase [Westerdykella ornata]KAF2275052.1 short-chain dehydrogenase/reductase [Westerdykella ornata]
MVALTEIRTHNASLTSLAPNLVAIFVGGTSGIGLSTAREFVRNTTSPHIYLVGRNATEAARIIPEFHSLNPSSKVEFIKSDVSLLRNADDVCRQIAQKEKKVNLLFMTMGYFTTKGKRDETEEGLDRKLALHYYSRMRFVHSLSPLLSAAGNDPDPKANLSRVVSVLDSRTGRSASLDFDDLSLKRNFGLKSAAHHACGMNSFALEYFAKQHPHTSYIHASPQAVMTNAAREMGPVYQAVLKVAATLMKPFFVDLGESGERHLFAATAPRFAPLARGDEVEGVARGSDEVMGSGSYAVNWDDEVWGESTKAAEQRKAGAVDKIWRHTEEVFGKIFGSEGKY